MHYKELRLKKETVDFIEINKFTELSKIQEAVLPYAIKGRDLIGISKTGTGKTHAYLIPLMEVLDADHNQVQAVIASPTRELAQQTYDFAKVMQEVNPNLRIQLISGGSDRQKASEKLIRQPHLVIGTVGRIKDFFVDEAVLRLDQAKILVVDEADMILEIGYLPDLDEIAGRMNNRLQMMVFSATIPLNLRPFMKKYMHNPQLLNIQEDPKFNPRIHHVLVPIKHKKYLDMALTLAQTINPLLCLLICNSRQDVAKLAEMFQEAGMKFIELRGDMSGRARKQAMTLITDHKTVFVIATDVAARGLDIPEISHVISVGFPSDLDFYVHRAGRTGRTGREGTCYALYAVKDEPNIRTLIKSGIHFEHQAIGENGMKDLKPFGQTFIRKTKQEDIEITKLVTKRIDAVKPGYKKKRIAEVAKIKQKKHREMIRASIKEQKKTRAKMKQIEGKNEQK